MPLLKVIFIGDIVGKAGREAVKRFLPSLKNSENCLVIANGENAAAGFGITYKTYKELLGYGVDIITGGNHIWDKSEVYEKRELFTKLALPSNLPKSKNDSGFPSFINIEYNGIPVTVINLSGKVFMNLDTNSPFETFDDIYSKHCKDRLILLDFHAEATSEKIAMGEYVDGRATAVFGTHTHVQTADERVLRKGTFFISDAGACCAVNSILGMTVDTSLGRFLSVPNGRMKVELKGPIMFNGVKLIIDTSSKKIVEYSRIYLTQ